MSFQTLSNLFQDVATLGVLAMQVVSYLRHRKTHRIIERMGGEIR